ncbi:hypothetical protein GF326_11050 [Candidatus Bathyarchaeota archaeon]|nr:hypothetical protein [Candidatus Bathyarchaeota archaeon]
MFKKIDTIKSSLDDLDILILNIIKKNAGISASLLNFQINHDHNTTINPAIILSRLDRLLDLRLIYNKTEQVGKYSSRRFYYNHQGTHGKDPDLTSNG